MHIGDKTPKISKAGFARFSLLSKERLLSRLKVWAQQFPNIAQDIANDMACVSR